MKIKLAIVGIEGLPNKYGGFETLASYLVNHLKNEWDISVYCSSMDLSTRDTYFEGARLLYLPLSSHGWQGVLYDIRSLREALAKNDLVLFLGFGAGIYFPFISKKDQAKIILNFGGLDWQRSKWNFLTRKLIQFFEALMVKNVNWVIADNKKIATYIEAVYHKKPFEIAYGGDQAMRVEVSEDSTIDYPFLKQQYACSVCRIQPDNNIELILKAFSNIGYPLVMIGNWSSSPFGKNCKEKYSNYTHLHLLDAIYDPEKLNMIRSNCSIYVHGHSAGGTNPSLIEAMHLGLNIFAYQSGYNEITTNHLANYFKTDEELSGLVNNFSEQDFQERGNKMQFYAKQHYTWSKVAEAYKELFLNVYHQQNGV
jgi:glycosyltransferase involved in cell wall biosynthesis